MNKTDKKNLFDKQRRQLAQKYRREKNRNKWLNKFVQLLFWFVFLYFSYELKLYELVTDFVSGPEIQIFAYVFVFSFLFFLFNMLTGYFLSYRVERKYELSNQNSREWLKDSGKGFLLNLVIFYFAARVLLLLINLFPDFWWFYFSLIAAGFLVLITFVMPKVLLPLFFTLEKYPAGELRDRLMSFIAQLDIDIEEIYEINLSSKINYANAAVVGLAGTRKILLGDNLTERYSPEEIEAVLAHELAHHINGDIIKNLIFEPFFLLASFFVLNLIWPRVLDLFSYSETFVYTLPVM
ncbi:MAG: M48 family metalloprotease, partial [Bacillota bacterium]